MGNSKPYPDKINIGQEDEMTIIGYRKSFPKVLLACLAVILSGGILLILMSWKRSIMVKLTHVECSLEVAEKVLLKDSYQQEYLETVSRPLDAAPLSRNQISFYNKKLKYTWHSDILEFVKVEGLQVNNCGSFHSMSNGLQTEEAIFRLQFYGKNSIFVEVKPVIKLILTEIWSPFYIYQMFIVVVWLIQLYYQFALCIVLLSIISVAATVWETRKQSKALRDAVKSHSVITLLRDGKEVKKSSHELVPGDVLILPQKKFTMECDAILINGSCVVNESMLTGESVPITKVSLVDDQNLKYSTSINKRSTLFCGTQVLHCHSVGKKDVQAVVYRTGYTTAKGELVRAILFPKPVNFRLYRELYKSMLIFLVIGIPAMIYTGMVWYSYGAYAKDIIITVVDVATFLVPPVLPAVLTSINAHAQRRLRKHGIYCLNTRYINFCGSLDVVCFDKTGTLTENSLDLSEVVPVYDSHFQAAERDISQLPDCSLLKAMAVCHSLTIVDGQLMGHILDVKTFDATASDLKEPEQGEQCGFEKTPARIIYYKKDLNSKKPVSTIAVLRQFPFESFLRRMSVITKTEGCDCFEVFLKGAPETVASLCKPKSIPENFKEVLEYYTRQGFRVLAVARKLLPDNITWDEALNVPREELENQLWFQGLLILQNCLKKETLPTLNILKKAGIRRIMVTGDNLLTAITVARECGMIEEYDLVVSVKAELTSETSKKLKIHYSYAKIPGLSEKLIKEKNGIVEDMCIPITCESRCHLAMEGTTFNLIRIHNPKLLFKVVHKGTIFARMLPEDKLYLIETLQHLGHEVGMCGDGANDCGALKTANAGVSLSVAEASVASPFTSKNENIQCIPTVIREGRATLAATFGAFRYMVSYCFVLLAAVLMMFWDGQKPTDGAYVIIDIVLNLLPPILFGSTAAYPGLVKRSPTHSILSFIPQFSMLSFILIQIGFSVFAWYYCIAQPWYEQYQYNKNYSYTPTASYMATSILSINMMSYVIAAVIFSPGPPYRSSFLSNRTYLAVVLAEFALVTYMIIYPADYLSSFINFRRAPYFDFHLVLYAVALADFIFCYIWETFIVQGVLFQYAAPALRQMRGPIHPYEKLEEELKDSNWPSIGNCEIYSNDTALELSGHSEDQLIEEEEELLHHSVRKRWSQQSSEHSLIVGLNLASRDTFKDNTEEHLESLSTFQDDNINSEREHQSFV